MLVEVTDGKPRKDPAVLLAVLMSLALVLPACSASTNVPGGGSVETTTPPPLQSSSAQLSGQVALAEAATKLDSILTVEFPSSFGGLEVKPIPGEVVVYRKQDKDLDDRVRGLDLGVRLEFADSRFSREDMRALLARILGEEKAVWNPAGVSISGLLPRSNASGIDGFVQADNLATAQLLFDRRYGDGIVSLSPGSSPNPVAPDAIPIGDGVGTDSGR